MTFAASLLLAASGRVCVATDIRERKRQVESQVGRGARFYFTLPAGEGVEA